MVELAFNLSESVILSSNYTLPHKIFTDDEALVHGKIMTCTICGIMQFSVLIQRHLKTFRFTSFIHGLLGICVYGLVMFAFFDFYGKFYVPDRIFVEKTRIHVRLGFTLCSLINLQVGLGVVTKFLIMYKKSMYLLLLTRKIHHMIGWVISISGLVNVYLGWQIKNKYSYLYYVYSAYILLVLLHLSLELRRRRKVSRSYSIKISNSLDSSRSSELISSHLTYPECIREIKKKNKKWIFFNDLILDVSSFATSHPGGSYLIDGILGEDSAKYIYGISNYSSEIPANIHSNYALKLTKQFSFSRVSLPLNILQCEGRCAGLKTRWNVVQVILLSSTMTCIELNSLNVGVDPLLAGFEWMGFHFRIKYAGLKRFYSFVAANLEKWANEVKGLNLPVHLMEYRNSIRMEEETLRIYVKKYNRGVVSKYLTELKPGAQITLKGPFGPGLGISRLPKGKCLVFAAGTGILPFLDLVHAIWKQAINEKFRLYLYTSFSCREDAIALDLLEATQKRFKDIMKLQIYLDKEKVGVRLTKENLKNWIFDDLKLTWICGPAGFNRFVQGLLLDYGVSNEKIMIL